MILVICFAYTLNCLEFLSLLELLCFFVWYVNVDSYVLVSTKGGCRGCIFFVYIYTSVIVELSIGAAYNEIA